MVTFNLQVIARRNAAAAAKQDPVQHQTTANGEKYALPNKPPSTKQQGVSICKAKDLLTILIACAQHDQY